MLQPPCPAATAEIDTCSGADRIIARPVHGGSQPAPRFDPSFRQNGGSSRTRFPQDIVDNTTKQPDCRPGKPARWESARRSLTPATSHHGACAPRHHRETLNHTRETLPPFAAPSRCRRLHWRSSCRIAQTARNASPHMPLITRCFRRYCQQMVRPCSQSVCRHDHMAESSSIERRDETRARKALPGKRTGSAGTDRTKNCLPSWSGASEETVRGHNYHQQR